MYSIIDYGSMIADTIRMDAYSQALRQAIKLGDLVLDIGAGTGIFSLLACRLGARQVIAIEPNDAIQVARQGASDNGCSDRICFIQDLSTRVTLPERVDVIISDLRGVLPLHEHHLPALIDARERLLAPGGCLLPKQDTLWAAVVEAPELYQCYDTRWANSELGFDLRAARPYVINTWRKGRVTPDQCLTEPQRWATIDYWTVEKPNVQGTLTWQVMKAGLGHGLNVWFDATLADGITFSNAPTAPKAIYGAAFFPWSQPVDLVVGDVVTVFLAADLVDGDYIWRWETQVLTQGNPKAIKATFKQSTFYGTPLAPAQLQKRAASYVPRLATAGEIDRWILQQMDGQQSIAAIAQSVSARYPQHFSRPGQALTHVGTLAQKYSR